MNNTDDIKKLIEEKMLELPESIRDVIVKSGWVNNIRNIVKKYNLRIDQGASLETETLLIMLGMETEDQYKKNLINEAQIDSDTADKITEEVNVQIFSLIRNKLVEEMNKDEDAKISERDMLLKEIEDKDENEIMIPSNPQPPSIQVNNVEQNQKNISNDFNKTNQNIVTQKLQTPIVSAPKTMTIDPYRELPE